MTAVSTTKPFTMTEMISAIEAAAIGKRALKADEAVHLWNRRIKVAVDDPQRGPALENVRSFGLQLFRRGLYLDCMDYLALEFGRDWRKLSNEGKLPVCTTSGKLIQLGQVIRRRLDT